MRLISKLTAFVLAFFSITLVCAQEIKYTAPMYVQECNNQIQETFEKHNSFVNLVNNRSGIPDIEIWKNEFDALLKESLAATKKVKKYKGDDGYAKALRAELDYLNSKEYKENLKELITILSSEEWQSNKESTNPKYKEIETLYNVRKTAVDALTAKRQQEYSRLQTTYATEFEQYFCDEWSNLVIYSKTQPTSQAEPSNWGMRYKLPNQFLGRFDVYALSGIDGQTNGHFMISLVTANSDDEVQATFNDAVSQLENCSFKQRGDLIHGYSRFSTLYKFPLQNGDYMASVIKNKYIDGKENREKYEVVIEFWKYKKVESFLVGKRESNSPKAFTGGPSIPSSTKQESAINSSSNLNNNEVIEMLNAFIDDMRKDNPLRPYLLPSFVESAGLNAKKEVNSFSPVGNKVLGNEGNKFHVAVWGKDKAWVHEVWFIVVEQDGKLYIDPTGVDLSGSYIDPWVELKQWSKIKIE